MSRLKEQFGTTISTLETEVEQLAVADETESVWNLRGRENIISQMRRMITKAQETIYLVAWEQVLDEIKQELEDATERGVHIVIISCGTFDINVSAYYQHTFEEEIGRTDDSSVDLVIDSNEVLVGETLPDDTCQAAWARNAGLVSVSEEYIRHEVYLHKIIARLGEGAIETLREALAEGLLEVPYKY